MTEQNLRRELGKHLTGMDNICFQLEDERRQMTICTIWTFNNRLDTTLVMAALENLCAHNPRFCLVPKHRSLWETCVWSRPHQHWKFRDNFIFHTLPNPTLKCLQQYVTGQYVKPFNRDKPLWEAHLISGLESKQFAFLWKVHHSLSDGIGMLKAILATTTSLDPREEIYRQWQQQTQPQQQQQRSNDQLRQWHHHSWVTSGMKTSNNRNSWHRSPLSKRHSPSTYQRRCMAREKYQQLQFDNAKRKFGQLWQQMMIWFLWSWAFVGLAIQQVTYELWILCLLMEPWLYQLKRLIYFFPLRRILFFKHHQQIQPMRTWSYDDNEQTCDKLIAWTDNLDKRDIEKAQSILGGGGTLDDMILLILGRAMQQYSSLHQPSSMDDENNNNNNNVFRILLPVSFRLSMDWTLKNATTGSMLELALAKTKNQVGRGDSASATKTTRDLLDTIHRHRMALQRSLAPYMIHYIIVERLLRYFPFLMVPSWIRQWYIDLPHATMASIAGPETPVFFGGQEIQACYVVPSQCGKGSISVGVVPFGEKINLSILTDNHPAYPDLANALCKLFVSEFNALVDEAIVMASGYGGDGIIM